MSSRLSFLDQFEASTDLPNTLIRLAEYVDSNPDWICDFGFVLDGKKWAEAWFDSDLGTAERFAVFGRTKSGGLFAFWKQVPTSLDGAPIVFLASECVGSTVVATKLEDWISCISFGSTDYELDIQYAIEEEWDGPEETTIELEQFREWCSKTLGVDACPSPSGIIRQAVRELPNLAQFIERWQAAR